MIAALDEVTVDYGRSRVLGPLTFEVRESETVALVGPSGCGKSTVMRLLAGLETPSSGGVRRTLDRGETALVFQSPTLMPWASNIDNVALPLKLGGVDHGPALRRAAAALEQVGLADAARLKPAQLSGGMAMRVALARALVARPRLLLLDEPFAALDEITRRTLADDVHRLWRQYRPAMVFVTHNVEEAAYMCERVVVMSAGPGRVAGEVAMAAPPPRPPGYRNSAGFREAAESVSLLLAQAMGRAA